MLSGPLALVESSSKITLRTRLELISGKESECCVREGKVGSSTPASLIVEFEANWSQRRWALEYDDTETLPSALTRGLEEDLDHRVEIYRVATPLSTHANISKQKFQREEVTIFH